MRRWRQASGVAMAGAALVAVAMIGGPTASGSVAEHGAANSAGATTWVCRPGMADDPCTTSERTTVLTARGATSVLAPAPARRPEADCFFVYATASSEPTENADLRVQKAIVASVEAEAALFSSVCAVWAPVYRQSTLAAIAKAPSLALPAASIDTAEQSVTAAFEDYLQHDNHGRPIVFIGHSQGAALLILLLQHLVDDHAALRSRVVVSILLGGNVQVPTGRLVGGTFSHLPLCRQEGETGCVIAYSSFPSMPPTDALFGRPGQGVSLQSFQRSRAGQQVACVNPAAIGKGSAVLHPVFPTEGRLSTPWVAFPKMYAARCEHAGGASWLEVTKLTGSSDPRPAVKEAEGPAWGYHVDDMFLALGDLVGDVQAATATYLHHRS